MAYQLHWPKQLEVRLLNLYDFYKHTKRICLLQGKSYLFSVHKFSEINQQYT